MSEKVYFPLAFRFLCFLEEKLSLKLFLRDCLSDKGEELSEHGKAERSVAHEFGLSTETIGLETFLSIMRRKLPWKAPLENWYHERENTSCAVFIIKVTD